MKTQWNERVARALAAQYPAGSARWCASFAGLLASRKTAAPEAVTKEVCRPCRNLRH